MSKGIYDLIGELRRSQTSSTANDDVGAKHSDDYLSGNPGYLFPNASPSSTNPHRALAIAKR
jgi:hypothetical protein